MEKFLKIVKINLLSLLALPLLLIATASKLIAKALEKVGVILGMTMFTFLLMLGFEFAKNPQGGLEVILFLIVALVIAFLIIMVIVLLLTIAAAVITSIWAAIIGIFEGIYDFTYGSYLKLYAACENDYQYISLNGKKIPNALFCLFYTILHGVSRLIVLIVSFALPGSIVLSVLLVGYSLFEASLRLKNTFGIGLIEFIGRFDTFYIIYGIAVYVSIMAIFVVVLLSLGLEWHEWAQELKMTGEELDENIRQLQSSDWRMARDADSDTETGDAYIKNLEEHLDSLEPLGNMVEATLAAKDNALLRSAWGGYFRNLSDIVEECSKYKKGIPLDKFKRLIPRIQQLEKQRDEVKSLAEKLRKENEDPVRASIFFSGCNNAEKLEKRYKSLCKAYHPDTEGGDTETFQKMQDEYTKLKEYFEP